MSESVRRKFKNYQQWYDYLVAHEKQITGAELRTLRQDTYKQIEALRGRPLIVYATNFLAALPKGSPVSIDVSDVDGFTDLINSIDQQCESIDVLIHSPGGQPDATERIVTILRNRFKEVHFLVPHSAYSAATMLALSGNTITLHKSATLGPIDPQLDGIPARSIKRGFEKVKDLIKKEGAEALPPYIPLIEKYSIHLLEICDDSEKLSKELVTVWLKRYMFAGSSGRTVTNKIKKIVKFFSDYDNHLTHARPITMEKIRDLGLIIEYAEGELSDLIWEAHILLSGFFGIASFVKLFENADGVSWGRQIQQIAINPPPQQQLK
jgi:hypothetical protein